MKKTNIVDQIFPPVILSGFRYAFKVTKKTFKPYFVKASNDAGLKQELDLYWKPTMGVILETWGEGNVWNEIQFLLANCRGRVLDIACGTGKTMEVIGKFQNIEVYGCDISDFLIRKAVERGIPSKRLVVCDATKTDYADNYFDYGYSIGSLEHFTEKGIIELLLECNRIIKGNSFFMVPVSRRDKDEGWIKPHQGYHNNSVRWWLDKYKSVYGTAYVLDSAWEDDISVGKWFVCIKR